MRAPPRARPVLGGPRAPRLARGRRGPLPRRGLDGRAADRAADRGARRDDARGDRRGPGPRRREDPAALGGGHGREDRDQRRHGRMRAGGDAGPGRGARGDARSGLQPLRRPGDDPPGGAPPDRARAGRRPPRHARRSRGLRPRQPRQRDARPRGAPVSLEPRRRAAGAGRHGDAGQPGQVHLRDRRARSRPSPWGPLHASLGFDAGRMPSRSSAARARTTSTTT